VHSIAAHYLLNHGTETQKRQYLPRLASGELIGAIAMTEPGAGSDLQGIRTRAERRGNHYEVNGSKIFITNGYLAGLVLLVVKTDATLGAKGTSILILETQDLGGYRVGRFLDKIGQRAQDTNELFFENVRVPAERLLGGTEGRGFAQLMGDLPYERMIVAVQAVAAMEGALEETIRYVKGRRAFGKTILEFQNARFRLAEAATITRVARTFIDRCIQDVVEGKIDEVTASMAKWWTTDMQQRVLDECVQLHGGYGYMTEYLVARLYADARVTRIYGGTNEIMKELIARSF
jgi:acyl-CoA dehydrogenase